MSFHSDFEKRKYVTTMFDRIAYRYDLVNRIMTGGQDRRWRSYLIREANIPTGGRLLDVATGTGDVAFTALQKQPGLGMVIGTDFSLPMLSVSLARCRTQAPPARRIQWTASDSLALPFPDASFDAVTSAFLLRNVTNVEATLQEHRRVTRPGGRVVALDITRPPDNLAGAVFRGFFHHVVPWIGGLISGQPDAYEYLPQSADAFLRPEQLADIMNSIGLKQVRFRMLMLGTVALHVGIK